MPLPGGGEDRRPIDPIDGAANDLEKSVIAPNTLDISVVREKFMDSLGSLNAFVQAADCNGFTEAGRKLGISASAISKAVQRLEDRLSVRLFHRSTRSITLTPEGTMFLHRCRRILGEFEAAETELSRTRLIPQGMLRVSLPSMSMIFMPKIAAFKERYPQIELELDFSDRIIDPIEDGFDAVIRTGDHADSGLMTKTMGYFGRVIVGAPAYFAKAGIPETPDDLTAHACLVYRFPTTGKLDHWPLFVNGVSAPVELTKSVITNTLVAQIRLAESGLGLVCVPDVAVAQQIKAGSLVRVLAPYLQARTKISVIWPTNRHLSPKLRAFVNYAASELMPGHDGSE